MIFIPKARKPYHIKAKVYRPISLCSLLLKALLKKLNGAPFTRILIFSDSWDAISSVSSVMINSSLVGHDVLSGSFSAQFVWVPGHSYIPIHYRTDELTGARPLLPNPSSIDLDMPITLEKLAFGEHSLKCCSDRRLVK